MEARNTKGEDALEVFAAWLSGREQGDASTFADLLGRHPDLATDLEELHATRARLADAGEPDPSKRSSPAFSSPSARIAELAARAGSFGRYEIEGEVARGGMGAILRVWDEDLRRHLAMKVVLGEADLAVRLGTRPENPRVLARFLEEAQVTSQLDHPGIVPVHELGLDSEGRVYFTMKLVEGRDLKRILGLVFEGREGWNETRALGVILKVCEAVAYAHKKGVIHRDLKPANVMVGSFGEVFVMDWGLARVLDRKDTHDIRIAPESATSPESTSSDSPVLTMDGDVVGTPVYMPPEQAGGEVEKLSPRSDVYSIGAMLYHLLARQMPYVPPGAVVPNRAVLVRVLTGPPRPLHELNPAVPAELAAICEKAMARDPGERYADTLALAEDLRAYLEHRVVGAYETGAVAELKKWIGRNRALASALAGLVLSLVVGLVVSAFLYVEAKHEKARADTQAAEASQRTDDVLALSAIQDLEDLVTRADAAWPPTRERIPVYESWLADARVLLDGKPGDPAKGIKAKPGVRDHERKLAEIESRGRARPQVSSAEQPPGEMDGWEFDSTQDRWWHAQLGRLVAKLKAFEDPETGVRGSGANPEHGWGVEKRLEFARTIDERSLTGAAASRLWSEAVASIADRGACPAYGGMKIAPQLGLVPIGRDPASGFWEFADLATGEPARRGEDGKLVLAEEMGIVFVLLPGGSFWMGSQADDPDKPGFDPGSASEERPVHEVTLAPFFLSKYEMTQGQWLRAAGTNPSANRPGEVRWGHQFSLLNPVDEVSWTDCARVMQRFGLEIPTEAQWEYGARGGTTTVWWSGSDPESLEGCANLADRYCKENGGPSGWSYDEWLDDGYSNDSPVGSFRANAFGLHDVVGNLWEWCRDPFGKYSIPERAGDGERTSGNAGRHAFRGGSQSDTALNARVALRQGFASLSQDGSLGLRPARAVDP
ncbi:MAG TPA: bifunctional serine/threonine-protein kinase/formylglycine-generating enzyme family protein [Planctomycetota bacterium]|nr:bifunctional serine/threonine-protein kinase/formylglycine-generating enzyme family protein [Planctomycetota bacterium]